MARKKVVLEKLQVVETPVVETPVVELHPSLIVESVEVCKDENGLNGKVVKGKVSPCGKFVTTLEGVTYAV